MQTRCAKPWDSPGGPRCSVRVSLLAMHTRSGHAHSGAEISEWMQDAGCHAPSEMTFSDEYLAAGPVGALVARKK